jgi:aspartate kinase
LPELDYEIMEEMAECGAKVLNARAVEWAKRHGVVIHARRTQDAVGEGRETLVVAAPNCAGSARAVVSERRLAVFRGPADAARALLGAAHDAGLSMRDMRLDASGWLAVVPLLNVPDFERACARMLEGSAQVRIQTGLASVSVVGSEAGTRAEVVADAIDMLDEPPDAVLSTPLRLTVIVRDALASELERRLHARFVPAGEVRAPGGSAEAAA